MTDHERDIVNMYNEFFEDEGNNFDGIAHRKKQHRFTSQLADVIVDSEYPCFYQAIECKSLKEDNNKKLYFSEHFSENEEGHQVERMTEFIERSGRSGYLALELKRGRGKPRKGILVPWSVIERYYDDDKVGMELDHLFDYGYELEREGSGYKVDQKLVSWLQKNHQIYKS